VGYTLGQEVPGLLRPVKITLTRPMPTLSLAASGTPSAALLPNSSPSSRSTVSHNPVSSMVVHVTIERWGDVLFFRIRVSTLYCRKNKKELKSRNIMEILMKASVIGVTVAH
jgi:hypothetical protein